MFVFHIQTNQPSGQLVGKLRAQDRDSPPHNSFYFNFIDGNGLESYLYIEKWTGLLRTASVLSEPRYLKAGVGVFEVDSTEPASAAEVIVHVLHPGDNTLFYLFRSSPIYRVHPDRANIRVGDTWSPEAVLVKMGMYDGNSTFNQTFAIASGNEEGYFLLDEVSGILRLLKRLGACRHFALNLTASRGHDSAWMIFNVSSDNKWCRLSDDNPNWSSISRFLHSDIEEESWRDSHPLASEQLSVVLSGVLVVVIVFVILGLFLIFETNKNKQASSPSSSHWNFFKQSNNFSCKFQVQLATGAIEWRHVRCARKRKILVIKRQRIVSGAFHSILCCSEKGGIIRNLLSMATLIGRLN